MTIGKIRFIKTSGKTYTPVHGLQILLPDFYDVGLTDCWIYSSSKRDYEKLLHPFTWLYVALMQQFPAYRSLTRANPAGRDLQKF